MKKTEASNGSPCVDIGTDKPRLSDIFALGAQIGAVENGKVYVTGQGLNGLYTMAQLEEHFEDPRDSNGI